MSDPEESPKIETHVIHVIHGMPIANALVQNVWRLMFGWNLYQAWYVGRGAFIERHPEVQIFVRSYFNEAYPAVAIATLCSATERLLRAALKAEGVKGPVLRQTLPKLLRFCISAEQKFFNLPGMCCDVRSINRLNAIRIGVEHGDHSLDQEEMSHSGWNPADVDAEYLQIIDRRLVVPHQQLCGIFNKVDPETGRFTKDWEPRESGQCPMPGSHDEKGAIIRKTAPTGSSSS